MATPQAEEWPRGEYREKFNTEANLSKKKLEERWPERT
jgi:hypothetical protein